MGLVDGKKIVVTGGSMGIGRDTALTMAREGADVGITYNSHRAEAQSVVEQIEAMGRRSFAAKVDVRDANDIASLVIKTKEKFGTLDVLVNNAGVYTYGLIEDTTEEDWDLNVDTSLKGTFLTSKAFGAEIFIPQKGGRILNMASFVGVVPVPNLVAYNVAKAGIIHLTKQMAMEWGKHNIEVVCVSPGYAATEPMLAAIERGDADGPTITRNCPIGRLAEPKEVANLFTYLSSDMASYISGSNILIDGGYTSGIRFSRLQDGCIVMD